MRGSLFKFIHRFHFKDTVETSNGIVPYYKDVVKITGWRSAYLDNYSGQRSHVKFMYWFDSFTDKVVRNHYKYKIISKLNGRKK